jgi:hypothetical protein
MRGLICMTDVYSEEGLEDLMDAEELDDWEEGFMMGFLQ